MSDVAVEVSWDEDQRFEAVGSGRVATRVDGRSDTAASPMEMLLMSVAACMGIDVVEILEKMRVPLEALTVRAEGERRPKPPRRYTAVRLVYRVAGVPEAEWSKLERAVELSRRKFCSVLHSLDPALELTVRIEAA